MNLIPYTKIDGQRNFHDSEIMKLYDRMVLDGTAKTVFKDGLITNRDEFLSEVKHFSRLHIAFDDNEPVAIVWLNRFEGRTARFHFCSFSSIWGRTVKIGRFILRELLNYQYDNGEYIYDAFIGKIPVSNNIGVNFVKRLGVKVVGELALGTWNEKEK